MRGWRARNKARKAQLSQGLGDDEEAPKHAPQKRERRLRPEGQRRDQEGEQRRQQVAKQAPRQQADRDRHFLSISSLCN